MWQLNDTSQNNTWIKEKISREECVYQMKIKTAYQHGMAPNNNNNEIVKLWFGKILNENTLIVHINVFPFVKESQKMFTMCRALIEFSKYVPLGLFLETLKIDILGIVLFWSHLGT